MMPKSLHHSVLFLVAILSFVQVYAQDDWMDFPTDGSARWSTFHYHIGSSADWLGYSTLQYTIKGDTIIQGTLYNKLIQYTSYDDGETSSEEIYLGAIHQEDKVLTLIKADSTAIDTLYDYSIEIGTFVASKETHLVSNCSEDNDFCPYAKLVSKDSVEIADGSMRERLNFEIFVGEVSKGYAYSWIEGIGSTTGLLNDPTHILDLIYSVSDPHPWKELLCFEQDGQSVYTGEQYEGDCYRVRSLLDSDKRFPELSPNVFPNPFHNEINIENIEEGGINLNYELVHLDGTLLKKGRLEGRSNYRLNTTELPQGFFLLKLFTEKRQSVFKVMKY